MERIEYLLKRYVDQTASDEEAEELFALIDHSEYEEIIKQSLIQVLRDNKTDDAFNKNECNNILQKILQSEKITAVIHHSKIKTLQWMRIAAAAVLIAAISTAAIYFFNHSSKKNIAATNVNNYENHVSPGNNKATLTLGNGSKIILDSVANGAITQQGITKVLKVNGGLLQYEANNSENTVAYNTLSTPRGGQYQIVLADGTTVWLNAASSLKYPTVFKGSERNVELTGEAYFEVAKNAAMPFIVQVDAPLGDGGTKVQVLGTHFNINSYNDEEVTKTTLLEGSVKISNKTNNILLVPGQQAITKLNGDNINVANVDAAEAIAWRYGRTSFTNENVKEIMRQVSRWYDVDVVYQGNISNRTFTGGISRTADISEVLNALKLNGYEFTLSGKTIEVKEAP